MKLVFPGSFDPITTGHMELIDRASKLSEQLYVVVEDNLQKTYLFTREQRLSGAPSSEGLPECPGGILSQE